jgi:hypothetical protein
LYRRLVLVQVPMTMARENHLEGVALRQGTREEEVIDAEG